MLEDVQVPAYYRLSRAIDEKRISFAVEALSITPPICVVITDVLEAKLANQFTRDIIQAQNVDEALSIATVIHADTSRSLLLVTDQAEELIAVYDDGSTQEIKC